MTSVSEFFAKHPVFTAEEFTASRRRHGSAHPSTRKSLLAHHEDQGRLLRVRRGLYAVVPPGATPETASVDPYLLASKLAPDAVLAYHTALELHGHAYSSFERYYFLTQTAARPMRFRSLWFQPVRVPHALREAHKENFGVKPVDRQGHDVPVTTLERTLVDVLDRPDLAGGWEEVWRSLESVAYFDLDQVVRYATLFDRATTSAKVGMFLESHAKKLMVEPSHLEALRKLRPKAPHYVDRRSDRGHRFVREWNLVVPTELAEKTWQEVG